MKRVFIIHCWSGGPNDDWRPWLKNELEQLEFQVFVPYMPDTEVPAIEKWVKHLSEIVVEPDSETFFVGHSIGCQTIIRYLETVNAKVGGAVFVAGWFNLENLEDEEATEIAKPWIEIPINFDHIKEVLPKSTLIISDNDPFGALEENKENFSKVGSKIVIVPGAKHFTENDGFVELPQVVTELKDMI